MKYLNNAFIGLLCAMVFSAYSADGVVPSCYDSKLPAPATSPQLEIFVIIDQTTLLDANLKQSVADQVRPFLVSGNSFSLLTFSAYVQGKYTQLLTNGYLEPGPSKQLRDDLSKPLLNKLDACLSRQPVLSAQAIGVALRNAFDGTSADIAKSDILSSLKDISNRVRQSPASEKRVLLVSDMLENSSIMNFYANQSVRKIYPAHEIQLVEAHKMASDFGGARLYVLGAGLLNNVDQKAKSLYRDPKTMQALKQFWQLYFEKSNAQLVEFGEPALLNQMK